MNFEDIAKGPVVDLNLKPAEESQVARIKRELREIPPNYLRSYIISKAEEFEKLRGQYEAQLSMARGELSRLGSELDGRNYAAAKSGYIARDQEWLKGIGEVFNDAQAAIKDGLVDIPQTLTMLKELLAVKAGERRGSESSVRGHCDTSA